MYDTLKTAIAKKQTTIRKIGLKTGIAPQDLYHAINGKKPFYPGWRKRVANALDIPEAELFPRGAENEKD